MAYDAIVCSLKNVRNFKDPKVNKIKLATVSGYQIISGIDHQEGELGIFFPSDGMLLEDHCLKNNLYRKHPDTGDPMGGYFGPNGRVKTLTLRGETSEGFWQPLEAFEWTGNVSHLKEGDTLTAVNGWTICQKYFTPSTKKAMNKAKNKKEKSNEPPTVDRSMLKRHYSTGQVRHNLGRIPNNAVYYITSKLHGTSGRTGRIRSEYFNYVDITPWWQKPFIKKDKRLIECQSTFEYEYVSGTRKVIMDPNKIFYGFYEGDPFRKKIHDKLESVGLYKGETIFYEIVGFVDSGRSIMKQTGFKDKKLIKKYGKVITYSYGCDPDSEDNKNQIYVYRITQVNEDGVEFELSWPQVSARCSQLGLRTVPLLKGPVLFDNTDDLVNVLRELSKGDSVLDPRHPREGTVVRIEHENLFTSLKFKSDLYCSLEGIQKQDPAYVDLEEVS